MLKLNWKKVLIALFFIMVLLPGLAGCGSFSLTQTAAPSVTPLPTEAQAILTETPVVTPAPLVTEPSPEKVLLEDNAAELPLPACYNLDNGQITAENSSGCDFYALAAAGQNTLLEFYPRSNALFSFGQVFWSEPGLQDCQAVETWSGQATALDTSLDYYLCYQTGEAHYGVLFVGALELDKFIFDWKTFEEINSAALLPTPEPTLNPEAIYYSAQNQNVFYEQSLDMDEGRLGWQGELTRADFYVRPGVLDDSGRILSVRFLPENGFIYASPPDTTTVPVRQDCENLKTYSSAVLDITAEDYYLCFISSEGRPGYIYLRELNTPLGLGLDWLIWDGPLKEDSFSSELPLLVEQPADQAELLVDITPGEEGVLRPNRIFTKKWILQNSGSTVWNTDYAIVFTGGRDMQGSRELSFNISISPGESVEVNLDFVSPVEYSTFMGTYMLRNAQGELFGIGENAGQPFYNLVHIGPAGQTFALVKDEKVPLNSCFDFDSGFRIDQENPLCDFSLDSFSENGMFEFVPDYYSSFGFTEVYAARPELSQCQNTQLSSETRFVLLQDWYVCFQTNLGRYGWMYFRGLDDQDLLFDWKLFE